MNKDSIDNPYFNKNMREKVRARCENRFVEAVKSAMDNEATAI